MGFKVLDASALLHSDLDFRNQSFLAPNSVVLEVIDEKRKVIVNQALRNGNLKIADPSRTFLEKAVAKASETGDLPSLSNADIDVIALALEKNAVVVSDDYAIQNTAKQFGLEVESAVQDGIKKTVKWLGVCEGCGRKYDLSKKGVCSVCGSKIRKKAI